MEQAQSVSIPMGVLNFKTKGIMTYQRYTIEVVDEDKLGDIEVELHLRDTERDRCRGTVSINGMDTWGIHGFADYVEEYGFLIIDNQITS